MRRLLLIFFLFFHWWFLPVGLFAQPGAAPDAATPLMTPRAPAVDRLADVRSHWFLQGLRGALAQGFFSVGATYADELLEISRREAVRAEAFNARLLFSLLQSEVARASDILEEMDREDLSPDPLLVAFFSFERGRLDETEDLLAELAPQGPREGWVPLLRALVATSRGNQEAANRFFSAALKEASFPVLRSHFELLRMRIELARGQSTEDTISALRDTYRSMEGERAGFEAARLLAIALYRSGQQDAAVRLLTENLSSAGLREFGLRGEFLFLLGLYAGPDSNRGRLALRELVAESGDLQKQRLALTLLVRSLPPGEEEAFLGVLSDWLNRSPPHPLQDQMLVSQAYLHFRTGARAAAAESARLLLERFPDSPLAKAALRLLAFIAYREAPPRYRTAADYLGRLQERLQDPAERLRTGALIGDCFFLNEDYASASEAYAAIFAEASPAMARELFYQRVLTHIRAQQLPRAGELIDRLRGDERLGEEVLWKAEWNLLDALRRENPPAAFARLQRLLGGDEALPEGLSPGLKVRLRWQQARLLLEEGTGAEALEDILALEEDLRKAPFNDLPEDLLLAVRRYLLLMRGEAYFRAGDPEEGRRAFATLRSEFPRSGPAVLSYLVESRSASNEDNLVSAQQSLIDLVDRFPDSRYAPIALWEAALKAEQRGLSASLQEAVNLLERLVTTYPDHELVFYARLKQGDLARRLNDFPTAMLLYENLLQEFPDHPEQYRAELSRADCLLALGGEDPARYDQAALLYERNTLLPTVPLPARLEAGYKWAQSLRQQGDLDGSEAVLFILLDRFVENVPSRETLLLRQGGRYWMARAMLDLAALLAGSDRPGRAGEIYEKLLMLELPGSATARSRLADLELSSSASNP